MVTTPTAPTWPALLMSMAFGEIEEGPFTGLLRITDPPEESVTVRVFKRFGEYRIETLGGELVEIRRHGGSFRFAAGIALPAWLPDDEGYRPPHAHVIERRELYEWRGDDFTRPTGTPQVTTFLGRPCWEVEFAPPEHKTSPLTLTIDAATGIQFKAESRDFGVFEEWTEIEFGVDLDDELFVWEGPTTSDHELWREEHPEHELHERRAKKERRLEKKWLRQSGIRDLTLRYQSTIDLHDFDATTGEFEGGFDADQWFSLGRRLPSDEAWDEHDDFTHEERWTDSGWQWRLRSSRRIRKRTLKYLQRQTRKL